MLASAMITFIKVESDRQINEIAQLAREIWMRHYEPIIGRAQVEYMLENFQSGAAIQQQMTENYDYFLVKRSGDNAGYLAVVPDNEALKLSKFYLRKKQRGQGLGKCMMKFVEQVAINREHKLIRLTVNKNNADSISWYIKQGFFNVGPVTQDIGGGFVMDDFILEKKFLTKEP